MPYTSEDERNRQQAALSNAELTERVLSDTVELASRVGTVKARRIALGACTAGSETMRAIRQLLDLVEECGIEEVRRAIAESRGDH